MRPLISWFATLWFGLVLGATAQGAIYKCVGAEGHVTFQASACDGLAPGGDTARMIEAAWPAGGKHLFWRASSQFGQIYLLGSVPVGASWTYPLPVAMTDALESADVLVVQANHASLPWEQLAARLERRGVYRDGTRLEQVLGPTNWAAVTNLIRTVGLPGEAIVEQKPWLAAHTLTVAALRRMGYSPELATDRYIAQQTHGRKPVVELESIDLEAELLDQLPGDQQVAVLMQAIQDLNDKTRYWAQHLNAWVNGDAERLAAAVSDSYAKTTHGATLYQRRVTERNNAMLAEINRLTRKHDVLFIVVDAVHLVGEEGVIRRMEKSGFLIDQL